MLDEIMEVLTPRRLMTVGNLGLAMEKDPEELHPLLMKLDADGRIRYAQSKCSGVCSTCSSCGPTSDDAEACGDEDAGPVDPTAIIISMELRKSED